VKRLPGGKLPMDKLTLEAVTHHNEGSQLSGEKFSGRLL
jgi:hypothetical protein